MFREHEHENLGSADRSHDAVGVERSRDNVPRGNPALKSVALQGRNDGIGHCDILRGIADENRLVRHVHRFVSRRLASCGLGRFSRHSLPRRILFLPTGCATDYPGRNLRLAAGDFQIRRQATLRTHKSRSSHPGRVQTSKTHSEHYVIESAVLPSEIEQLPDLAGYLKLASSPSWRRVTITRL